MVRWIDKRRKRNFSQNKDIILNVRLDADLDVRLNDFVNSTNIDKRTWVRQAIISFLDEMDDEMEDKAIEDYICARITSDEFKSYLNYREIPADLEQKRKEYLDSILDKVKK